MMVEKENKEGGGCKDGVMVVMNDHTGPITDNEESKRRPMARGGDGNYLHEK